MSLWFQHPDLKSVTTNLRQNSTAGLLQKKNHNVNGPTLWMALSNTSLITLQSTDEWCDLTDNKWGMWRGRVSQSTAF